MAARTKYSDDVVAWAREQAAFLRARRFSDLDLEFLAGEIDDVGNSEERALASQVGRLLAHLLKWQVQPGQRSRSRERTIKDARGRVLRRLERTPSLRKSLDDPDWITDAWSDAVQWAAVETGLDITVFPETCSWPMSDIATAGSAARLTRRVARLHYTMRSCSGKTLRSCCTWKTRDRAPPPPPFRSELPLSGLAPAQCRRRPLAAG